MPKEFGEILTMTVDELILDRCDEIQNEKSSVSAEIVERILDLIPPSSQAALENYITDCISDNADTAGKMYVQGFHDCLAALKQAGKL